MENERHRHPCDEVTRKVIKCHRKYGKEGEDCVREELSQKKCFAQLLCRREAHRFYDERSIPMRGGGAKWGSFLGNNGGGGDNGPGSNSSRTDKVSCATLLETFAKPENELLIPEGIGKDDRIHCRKIAHELATCLSKKRRGSTTSY
eukprot:90186_1